MRDGPDGATLLRIARASLLDELLPRVAPELRYMVRMIARATEIAGRELASDAAATERAANARLDRAYGAAGLTRPAAELSLHERERCFARDLRSGRFDGYDALIEPLLAAMVSERLALSNPKLAGGATNQALR